MKFESVFYEARTALLLSKIKCQVCPYLACVCVNVHQKTLKTLQRVKAHVIHFNVAWIAPYKLDIKEEKNAISEMSIVLMLNIPLQKKKKETKKSP